MCRPADGLGLDRMGMAEMTVLSGEMYEQIVWFS